MRRHRRHSIEFKREVVQAHLDGETLYGLAKQYDIDSNLIRGWVRKYESGEFDAEVEAAKTLYEYQAKVAQLERKVGQGHLDCRDVLAHEKDMVGQLIPVN